MITAPSATIDALQGTFHHTRSHNKENTMRIFKISYGLKPTPFSIWAREHGAGKSIMGWGMLVEQAAESFKLWRGIRPDTAPVLKQMSVNA